ncbi:uncharacterized protein RJT21DRAFT_3111 [Scheffersomyces amazonensis]|uniref:uncharacterized protein n=1 Tax=Scheffersomyces amazonensis TaxID=1078765 RepID=UPI00315D90F2
MSTLVSSNIPPPQFSHDSNTTINKEASNNTKSADIVNETTNGIPPEATHPANNISNNTDNAVPRSLPPSFSRRVSFNNLHPEYLLECPANSYVPTIANSLNPNQSAINSANVSASLNQQSGQASTDFGYGSTIYNNDLAKTYSHYTPYRKKLRLPDPPSKSILKNKVSPQQLEFNITGKTIDYHEDLDLLNDALDLNPNSEPRSRRKSYSDMTNEELMALDPQFQTTRPKTNVDQFKFDNQKTYYLTSSKRTSISGQGSGASSKLTYPSSNENNYKSISITVKHDEYDTVSFGRTLLTVISGRKHTWNSLDWLFLINEYHNQNHTFLIDGDFLIISSLITQKFIKEYNPRHHKRKSIDDYLYAKGETLIHYLINALFERFNLKLKITIEFVLEYSDEDSSGPLISTPNSNNSWGNKYMLQHLFKQYHPNIILIGNKSSNLNFKYPIKIKKQFEKDEYLIKLASYIVKYSTIPVILVGNNNHEHHFQNPNAISSTSATASGLKFVDSVISPTSSAKQTPIITLTNGSEDFKLTKFRSNSSSSSIESVESWDPSRANKQDSQNPKSIASGTLGVRTNSTTNSTSSAAPSSTSSYRGFLKKLEDLDRSTVNTDPYKFQDLISLISDQSLTDCKEYLEALNSKDDNLKINPKIHWIYRAQSGMSSVGGSGRDGSLYSIGSNGSREEALAMPSIYKVKSLISYNEEDEQKNKEFQKELKKKRSGSSVGGVSGSSSSGLKTSKSIDNSANSSDSDITAGDKGKKKSIWKKFGFRK